MKKILAEVDRRNFFKYMGKAALFYPVMRTFSETEAFGANTTKRAVFFYFPSGIIQDMFHPAVGPISTLPVMTAGLKGVKDDVIIIKGVDYKIGHSHNEGTRYALTGATSGASVDNLLGEKLKAGVKLPVLRLGIGSHCCYGSTVSWGADGNPADIWDNPKFAFAKTFGGAANAFTTSSGFSLAELDPNLADKSVLDFCVEDIKSLQLRLGSIEKQKLDFHLQSLRELERRIQVTTMPSTMEPSTGTGGGMNTPSASCTKQVDFKGLSFTGDRDDGDLNMKENFHLVSQAMQDLAVQSLACGMTNVVLIHVQHSINDTFAYNFPGGPNANYNGMMANHALSHHDNNPPKMAEFAKVQGYLISQFASLTSKMKAVTEGDKTLLYNSVALAFSELGDPGEHKMENVGLVMAGQGGGRLKTGRTVDATGQTQTNVLSSVCQAIGVDGVVPGVSIQSLFG